MGARKTKPKINLALQGGGAHGAFTWGVLDLLLERDVFNIEAISGTSAGAMNAVALLDGWMKGGKEGAREHLNNFWLGVSAKSQIAPVQRSLIDKMLGSYEIENTMGMQFVKLMSQFASPYEFNPLNINPLKAVIERLIDFESVRKCTDVKLFISATNVHTGRARIFTNQELTVDALMASACLPHIFQAVEIDGVPYWDGGYMGNPALWPFFYNTESEDIVLVQVNPIELAKTPKSAQEILNRLNQITFNSSLLGELRAIDFVNRLIEEGTLSRKQYKAPRLHNIAADTALEDLSAATKLLADWSFLTELHDRGREAAAKWLRKNKRHIGKKPTFSTKAFKG